MSIKRAEGCISNVSKDLDAEEKPGCEQGLGRLSGVCPGVETGVGFIGRSVTSENRRLVSDT